MVKTYPHAVIYNGVFYPAGAEIKTKATTEDFTAVEKAVTEHDTKPSRKPKSRNSD